MNKKAILAIGTAAFLIGGGFGNAVKATAEMPAQKTIIKTVKVTGPTVTKTVNVKVPGPTVTKTVEVTVPGSATNTTPASCLEALDLADEGFGYATDGFSAAVDALTAIGNLDVDGVTSANVKLTEASTGINSISDDYNAAKAACRS